MQYVFGGYTLDTQCYELRSAAGVIPLDRQGFTMLVYLVQHRNRVVLHQELFDRVWPERFVSDASLEHCIAVVRRAVGDSGRTQRIIQTVHGRGYRFVVAVEERGPGDVALSAREMPTVEIPALSCPRCQHVNLLEAQFCNACAAPLVVHCRNCGRANPPGAAFCDACATSLHRGSPAPIPAADALPAQTPVSTPEVLPSPEAERRHLTVVFCGLVESTSLAERLDPEDYGDVVQTYLAACTDVIQRYDGHIAQLLGETLLMYFGWPTAHEDDAQRAVHAGLEMLGALADANRRLEPLYHVQLAMRVAVHTGLVVVGEMGGSGRQEQLALGATPNVAARLQALAPPGSVVISAATYALVQGYCTTSALEPQALRGVASPVQVYR